jgi:uncharacterized protein with HEPN domain
VVEANGLNGEIQQFIHGYDSVSTDILWNIIVQRLPLLKQEIQELLK